MLALAKLQSGERCVVILPVSSLMNRLPPTDFIAEQVFDLHVGQRFDAQATRRLLEAAGYRCVETAYEHGEYARLGDGYFPHRH